jgi:hypothetical protein
MNFLAKSLNERSDGALYIRDERITLGLHDEQALYPANGIGGTDAGAAIGTGDSAPELTAAGWELHKWRAIPVRRASMEISLPSAWLPNVLV